MTSAGTRDPAVSASRDTLTVCILDDEAAVLEMLQSTVEQMGYPTLTTTAPEEALEHIQAGRCRVVLSDIKMPAMDGLAFLERVLEHDPGVYVILMTGFYSRSEEHTSELQSLAYLVCRLLLEKKKKNPTRHTKSGMQTDSRLDATTSMHTRFLSSV